LSNNFSSIHLLSQAVAVHLKLIFGFRDECRFELTLLSVLCKREEVKVIRVFQELLSEIGLRSRQGPAEISLSFALSARQITLNLRDKDVSAPAVLDCCLSIPEPFLGRL
jgi:hypothetical protein